MKRYSIYILMVSLGGTAAGAYGMLVPSIDAPSVPYQQRVAEGNAAYESRNLKKAEVSYRKALKKNPKSAAAINNLAMVYLAKGELPEDIAVRLEDALEKAGDLQPYLFDTLANLAVREGRYTDAEYALQRAAEKAPKDPLFLKQLEESRAKLDLNAQTFLTE
jgi:Flp pilus assembly protein TadD